MRITNIEARDLQEAWFLSLRKILQDGYQYRIDRGSFEGTERKELDFTVIHITNPGMRPLVPTVPDGIPAPTSMEYIENYLPYLLTSDIKEGESYTYGTHIEKQIFTIINNIKQYGFNTNQTYITVGTPESVNLNDPECLRGIDIRVRYGAVHFVVYFRSWDAWGGFPSNLAGIQLMKEWVAGELDVEDGEIIALSKGLHLYDYAWEIAKATCRL